MTPSIKQQVLFFAKCAAERAAKPHKEAGEMTWAAIEESAFIRGAEFAMAEYDRRSLYLIAKQQEELLPSYMTPIQDSLEEIVDKIDEGNNL